MIPGWYYKEKLDDGHSLGVNGLKQSIGSSTFTDVEKNIHVYAIFINETWHADLQDPESEIYRSFKQKLFLQVSKD